MSKAKELTLAAVGFGISLILDILKKVDPQAYNSRVRRGLVKTGDDVVEKAHPIADRLMNAWKEKEQLYVKKEFTWKQLKHLKEYCRKWEADRDNIT